MRDLRISVTDRCTYCMPKSVFDKDYHFLPRNELVSFEEIYRMARLFAAHGVGKIRLTGGEPLLRKNLEVLIEMLAALKTHDGNPLILTLTTNASLVCVAHVLIADNVVTVGKDSGASWSALKSAIGTIIRAQPVPR